MIKKFLSWLLDLLERKFEEYAKRWPSLSTRSRAIADRIDRPWDGRDPRADMSEYRRYQLERMEEEAARLEEEELFFVDREF